MFLLAYEKYGSRMVQLEMAYTTTTIAMPMYLSSTTDWMVKLTYQHQYYKKPHSIIKEARKYESDLTSQVCQGSCKNP